VSDKSGIEWTDATWNPTTGCDRVSPGCAHCYALDLAARLKLAGAKAYQRDGDPRTSGPGFGLTLHPDRLEQPLRWTRPRRIFVDSMSDLFHELVPDDFLDQVFAVMALAPQHTFQVLTKRPARMREYLSPFDWRGGSQVGRIMVQMAERVPRAPWHGWPLPNVWLGTSVENQHWADVRIPELLATPAEVRFLSCEPLLGPIDLDRSIGGTRWLGGQRGHAGTHRGRGDVWTDGTPCPQTPHHHHDDRCGRGVDWIIVGGESGPEHRPIDPAWVRGLRDQTVDADVAFFFKQWGGRTPKAGGRELDGRTWDEFPAAARAAA
jgi:protein gp37